MSIIKVLHAKDKTSGQMTTGDIGMVAENVKYDDNKNLKEKIQSIEEELPFHVEDIVYSKDGVHNLRFYEDKLQQFNKKSSAQEVIYNKDPNLLKIGDVIGPHIWVEDGEINLTQTDPEDIYIDGELAVPWAGTTVVYSPNAMPQSEKDGDYFADSTIRDEYSSTPAQESITLGVRKYYVRFFPYKITGQEKVYTAGTGLAIEIQAEGIDTIPSQLNTLTYTGNTLTPTQKNYDSNKLIISGETEGINAGTYEAIFTPKTGYYQADGTEGGKTITWKINKANVDNPRVSIQSTYTYTGNPVGPEILYTPTGVNWNGREKQINVGSYQLEAYLIDPSNYKQADGTASNSKYWYWSIVSESVPIPTLTQTFIYNSTTIQVVENYLSNYNPDIMSLSGTTEAKDAGLYTYTISLNDPSNLKQTDGTNTPIHFLQEIQQAPSTLSIRRLNPDPLNFDNQTPSGKVTIQINPDEQNDINGSVQTNFNGPGLTTEETFNGGFSYITVYGSKKITTTLQIETSGGNNYEPGLVEIPIQCNMVELGPQRTATNSVIEEMINSYYNKKITLEDITAVQSIGDGRDVNISAIPGTGNNYSGLEDQPAQTITLVILDFNVDTLTSQYKALITVATGLGQNSGCLLNKGCMGSTRVVDQSESPRYYQSIEGFSQALPTYIKTHIRYVKKAYGYYYFEPGATMPSNNQAYKTTKIFLLAEKEVFGNTSNRARYHDYESNKMYNYFNMGSYTRRIIINSTYSDQLLRSVSSRSNYVYAKADEGTSVSLPTQQKGIVVAFCL